jgi:hypothetical protein
MLTLTLTLALGLPVAQPDPTKEVKVLATGEWRPARGGPGQPARQLVLRSAAEAARAVGQAPDAKGQRLASEQLAKALKVAKIDWDKQMVVVVSAGTKRTGGYRVEIQGAEVRGDKLTVQWVLHSPRRDQPVTQSLTYPAQAALLTKFAGPVAFSQAAAPRDGRDRK